MLGKLPPRTIVHLLISVKYIHLQNFRRRNLLQRGQLSLFLRYLCNFRKIFPGTLNFCSDVPFIVIYILYKQAYILLFKAILKAQVILFILKFKIKSRLKGLNRAHFSNVLCKYSKMQSFAELFKATKLFVICFSLCY